MVHALTSLISTMKKMVHMRTSRKHSPGTVCFVNSSTKNLEMYRKSRNHFPHDKWCTAIHEIIFGQLFHSKSSTKSATIFHTINSAHGTSELIRSERSRVRDPVHMSNGQNSDSKDKTQNCPGRAPQASTQVRESSGGSGVYFGSY